MQSGISFLCCLDCNCVVVSCIYVFLSSSLYLWLLGAFSVLFWYSLSLHLCLCYSFVLEEEEKEKRKKDVRYALVG